MFKVKINLDEDHPEYENLKDSMPKEFFAASGEYAKNKMVEIATKIGIDHVGFEIEKED